MNNNAFTLVGHHKEIGALGLPGFVGQDKTPIALIVFYTKWKFPFIWIEAVINAEYQRGVILHMQSYDVMANAEMCVPEYGGSCEHHHAYTSNGTECIQSGHCAILIKVEQGGPVMFDETDHGDYDLYLPLVDDDGNEVEDGRAQ